MNNPDKFKNTSKGSLAPDFYLDAPKNTKKLSNLTGAEYYILVFWSSTCSHCLKEMPKLEDFVKPLKESEVKVIAIGMENDETTWAPKIKELPHFTHVLGLEKWENPIAKQYKINATPTFFILDKNKRFVSKPENIEDLKSFFKNLK